MEWIEISGLAVGVFPALRVMAPGLEVYVTTRGGGVSPAPFDSLNLGGTLGDAASRIRENRRRLLAALGIPARRLARTGQVHGAEIAVVTRGGHYPGHDGLVTARAGLALAISTADCYSLVLYSPPERVLAALHVGRRGAERGIVDRAVEILANRFHVEPAYAVAAIGPGICGSCYTVSRADAMRFPRASRCRVEGAWRLDIEDHIRGSLASCGLGEGRILSAGACNACDAGRFYSHRRDGGITGRHWTIARFGADEGTDARGGR